MRKVMQLIDLLGRRTLLAEKSNLRRKRHLGNPEFSVLILGHLTDCIVGIVVHNKPLLGGDVEKRQHVAARERRDQCFLRIDGFSDRPGQPHAQRRRRGGNGDPAIEAPPMAAAVALVGELRVAAAPPFHARAIFVRHENLGSPHSSVLRNSLYCSSLIRPSSCSGVESLSRKNQPFPSASSLIVAGAPSSDWFTATTSPLAGA